MSGTDAAAIGAGIEELIRRMGALGDSAAAAEAQELVRLVLSLHGAGLSRVLEIVGTDANAPPAALDRLAADPLVASLLVLHDLHPHPVEIRVQRALAALGPALPVHTHVTLLAVDRDSARVKVERSTTGRPHSPEAIRSAIEQAIQEAAPEVGAIHIDGLAETLIQIARPSRSQPGDRT